MSIIDDLRKLDIRVKETTVGDKNVMSEMIKTNSILGGEPCGHIIFCEFSTTGDGILTALKLISVMKFYQDKLITFRKSIKKYPQNFCNVRYV